MNPEVPFVPLKSRHSFHSGQQARIAAAAEAEPESIAAVDGGHQSAGGFDFENGTAGDDWVGMMAAEEGGVSLKRSNQQVGTEAAGAHGGGGDAGFQAPIDDNLMEADVFA